VGHLCAEAVAKFGTLDILVNNASVFAFASFEQTTDEQLHKMLDSNLWGTIIACREACARAIGAMTDETRAAHIARTPLGRVGTPADIASVAVLLASDEAGWITGECLAVSGGLR
jgi:NAD(P)-dependent dehydrogenase (short-subunit alcohol dehydrogenase family)